MRLGDRCGRCGPTTVNAISRAGIGLRRWAGGSGSSRGWRGIICWRWISTRTWWTSCRSVLVGLARWAGQAAAPCAGLPGAANHGRVHAGTGFAPAGVDRGSGRVRGDVAGQQHGQLGVRAVGLPGSGGGGQSSLAGRLSAPALLRRGGFVADRPTATSDAAVTMSWVFLACGLLSRVGAGLHEPRPPATFPAVKILYLALAASVTLTLTACGGAHDSSTVH